MTHDQTIEVPLSGGDRVTLYEDVNMDSDGGLSAGIAFEGEVEQFVPETALLEFKDAEIGYASFQRLVEEAAGIEVVRA